MNARSTFSFQNVEVFLRIALMVIGSTQVVKSYSCGDPGLILNGDRIFWMNHRLVQYVCNENYQIYGSPMLSCTKGQWRGSQPVCVATGCFTPPQHPNLVHTPLLNGAVLKYECVGDLVLRGNKIIYCDQYQWSGPEPTCERIHKILLPGSEDAVELKVPIRQKHTIPSRASHGEVKMRRPIFLDSSDQKTTFGEHTSNGNGRILPLYKTKAHHGLGAIPIRSSDPSRIQNPVYRGRTYKEYFKSSQYDGQNRRYSRFMSNYAQDGHTHNGRYLYHVRMRMAPHFSYTSLNFGSTEYRPFSDSVYGIFPHRNGTLRNKMRFESNGTPDSYASSQQLPKLFPSAPAFEKSQKTKRLNEMNSSQNAGPSRQRGRNITNTVESIGGLDTRSNTSFKKLGSIEREISRKCPPPKKPKKGYHITRPLPFNGNDEKYQYYIEYHCFDGFAIAGGENKSYCTVSGQWTGTVPSCEEIRESCKAGFKLNGDRLCIDMDECERENGGCEQICRNFLGGYYCECSPGYGSGQDRISCIDIDECSIDVRTCFHDCHNTPGSFACSCREGYSLLKYDNNTCIDINECMDKNFKYCDQLCENTFGSFRCSCKPGFKLNVNGQTCSEVCPQGYLIHIFAETNEENCVDENECLTNNGRGACEQVCLNTEGSFACSCAAGYLLNTDGLTCYDVDECTNDTQCEHGECQNTVGGYRCACPRGYENAPQDKRVCKVILRGTCHPLDPLENGRILPSPCTGEYEVPLGRVCVFVCHGGFKLEGSSRQLCEEKGWSGSPARCVFDFWCPPLPIPEGVVAFPRACEANSSRPWMICIFQCKDPSQVIQGSRSCRCGMNKKWDRNPPRCIAKPTVSRLTPKIVCPPDIDVDLAPGASTANVTVNQPVTNMQIIEQRHDGRISRDSFQAGVTRVTFTAFSDDRHNQASCEIRVRVRDTEAPLIKRCPESLSIETKNKFPVIYWKPPLFSDNVGVTNVEEMRQPQGNMTWGTYSVRYEASDAAGNLAECAFTVSIKRPVQTSTSSFRSCGKPVGPRNGKAICQTWAHGVYCIATCNIRYAFERRPPTFVCNENGQWTPSSIIPNCIDFRSGLRQSGVKNKLQTTTISDSASQAVVGSADISVNHSNTGSTMLINELSVPLSSTQRDIRRIQSHSTECRRGMVAKISPDGEKLCFNCPPGTYGPPSTTSNKCRPCAPGHYQHLPGMKYCIQCPNYAFFRRRFTTDSRENSFGFRSPKDCQEWIRKNTDMSSKSHRYG